MKNSQQTINRKLVLTIVFVLSVFMVSAQVTKTTTVKEVDSGKTKIIEQKIILNSNQLPPIPPVPPIPPIPPIPGKHIQKNVTMIIKNDSGDVDTIIKTIIVDLDELGDLDGLKRLEDLEKEIVISEESIIDTEDFESNEDTIRFRISNMTVLLIPDKTENTVEKVDKEDNDDHDKDKKHDKKNKIWEGIDLGINGYLNADNQTTLPANYNFMKLKAGKSWSVGINLAEKDIPIASEYLKLVTGFGLEINNYRFSNNTLLKDLPDSFYGFFDTTSTISYSKSKLRLAYIDVPVLLCINTNKNRNKAFHFAGGFLFGYNIGAKTKVNLIENGRDFTDKQGGEFFINDFKYGLTARVGYDNLRVFANYNLNTLFEKDKGPELYPFSVGLTIIPF